MTTREMQTNLPPDIQCHPSAYDTRATQLFLLDTMLSFAARTNRSAQVALRHAT
jgi:hypothetical protein